MLLVIACKVVKLTNERACETMVDRQFDDRIGQKRTNERKRVCTLASTKEEQIVDSK